MTDARTIIELDVTGLSEAEVADLRAHVRGKQPGPDYDVPKHGWTCFHCGETFRTPGGAEHHFGKRVSERPLCIADQAELAAVRRDRDQLSQIRARLVEQLATRERA